VAVKLLKALFDIERLLDVEVKREEQERGGGVQLEIFNDGVCRDFATTEYISTRVYESISVWLQCLQSWIVLLQATHFNHVALVLLLLVALAIHLLGSIDVD